MQNPAGSPRLYFPTTVRTWTMPAVAAEVTSSVASTDYETLCLKYLGAKSQIGSMGRNSRLSRFSWLTAWNAFLSSHLLVQDMCPVIGAVLAAARFPRILKHQRLPSFVSAQFCMLLCSLNSWTTWATCLVAVLGAATSNTPKRSNDGNIVKLDFTVLRGSSKSDAAPNRQARLRKRTTPDGAAAMELENQLSYYSCDLYIGSNSQKSTVLVDTGSSDLWIMDTDIQCLALSFSRKRDYSAFYRVVEVPKVNQADSENVDNAKRAIEAKNKRADNKMANAKREECLGFFCMSSIIVNTFSTSLIIGSGTAPGFTATGNSLTATRTRASSAASATGGGNSCTQMGSFETADSDSFKVNSSAPAFSIQYADGTSAEGFWGHDQVGFNGVNVTNLSFATVNVTDSTFGVLGIGLPGLETTYSGSLVLSVSDSYMYENLPLKLRTEGIIDKIVYSLYLNTQDALSGSVLFGAVDHAKYSGTLQTVPIINIYSDYYSQPIRLDVVMDSIILEGQSSNVTVTTVSTPALLDSGTTLSYLPSSILSRLTSSLSATYSLLMGMYTLDCRYNSDSLFAIFNFSGAEIKVPLSDLVLTYRSQCYLGVLPQSSLSSYTYAILGDNFLRNAYVVYDLEDLEILMAQVNYTDDEDIEVVSLTVPLAVQAASYSATSINSSASDLGTTSGLKTSGGLKKSVCKHAMLALASLSLFALM